MRQKGRMLVAPAVAELRYGPLYKARSQKIWVHLPEEVFVLAGKVVVESIPAAPGTQPVAAGLALGTAGPPGQPAVLTAERLVYERKRRQVRLEGGTHLQRGREFVKARKLSANLSADERTMVFLRALWDVTGQIAASEDGATTGGATTVHFRGRDLAVFMQPESNEARKVALDGGEQQRARMEAVGGGVTRLLTARRIEGILAQGVLTSAEAFGGVEIDETAPGGKPGGGRAVRHAEGQRAQARFSAGGQLAGVDLVNNVVYRDPQVRATGDRATVDFDAGNGEFLGDPVDVVSERGKLKAPRVLYETKNQVVHAVGGVRGVMEQVEDTSLAGTPLGEGEGPVWVESQEAFWRQSPSSFLFRGDVRAWRGKSLLLASELRGDKADDQLTGKGGVKTVWIPPDETARAAGGRPRRPAGSAAASQRAPIEVTAREMAYREGAGILTYTGDVRVLQTGKTLTCNQLQVELGEDDKAETMTCTGEAKLTDPKEGRNITGERAVYHLDRKLVEMFGEAGLVTMRDRQGNQVQGKRLVYHIDNGKTEFFGSGETAAPAAKSGGAE
jgi:lipopolysaccharide transport protein LptA